MTLVNLATSFPFCTLKTSFPVVFYSRVPVTTQMHSVTRYYIFFFHIIDYSILALITSLIDDIAIFSKCHGYLSKKLSFKDF